MHADGPTTHHPDTVTSPAPPFAAEPTSGPGALLTRAVELLHGRGAGSGRTILGLTGPPGAGKSTLAHYLVTEIDCREGPGTAAYLPLDGFHFSNTQLDRLGLRSRKGAPPSFDAWGYVALLRRVVNERFHDVYAPDFDRTLDEPVAARHVIRPHTRLVITEGNYLANADAPWPEARGLLRELWYVDTEDAVREERLLRRHTIGGQDAATARRRIASNDHLNGEYVKSARAVCTRVVRAGDLPVAVDGRSVH
ncbi:nucleoside/nucleotide kinase family protein [Kitasatospora sp. MAP5-34]|uniref:nucleoside/nucleotide kinase family protein n=1 Tax=Kitasatospora sp. MAP5-34 TaxID=3035102 RepID=UPI0024749114|nr:nucleoside/nucleotide kinase family protein [Kitasatospora sp. MAP5-34]MDH6578785.1 pantothenate kinase [Kitasatospora sp. MAP5-34]